MFKSARLLRHFLDAFDCEDEEITAQLRSSDETLSSKLSSSEKKSLRGFVINCCNAIRLQVSLSLLRLLTQF